MIKEPNRPSEDKWIDDKPFLRRTTRSTWTRGDFGFVVRKCSPQRLALADVRLEDIAWTEWPTSLGSVTKEILRGDL